MRRRSKRCRECPSESPSESACNMYNSRRDVAACWSRHRTGNQRACNPLMFEPYLCACKAKPGPRCVAWDAVPILMVEYIIKVFLCMTRSCVAYGVYFAYFAYYIVYFSISFSYSTYLHIEICTICII